MRTTILQNALRSVKLKKSTTVNSVTTVRKAFLAFVALVFSWLAYSQTISVGSPNDGTEPSSPISFVVSLDNGVINNTGSDITGTIVLVGGTASPVGDFIAPVSFAIPDGFNSIGILVPLLDDVLCEGIETAIFSISNPSVGSINPAASTVTTNIIDDDFCYIISISPSVQSVVEGSSDVIFDVFIEGGLLNNSGAPITGSIGYGGTATTTADYMPVGNYSIPVGANSTTITVPVVDDATIESTESLTIFLTGSPSVGSYGNTTTTVTIIDNDPVSLSLSIGSPVDGEEGIADGSFVVSLDGGLVNYTGLAITGMISFGGTATDGSDYSAVGTFSIPDGQNSTQVTFIVVDDLCVEFTETVEATISNPSTGTINIATATANIIDNDASVATISILNPVNGEEGVNDASFDIVLDNGLTNCSGAPITGSLYLTGTATAGVDFTNTAIFEIPDGASFTTLVLPVIDDTTMECDETILATIGNPSIGTISLVDTSTAIIFDDECMNSLNPIEDAGLEIYPNPTSSVLNLSSEVQMKAYSIIDLNGRVIDFGGIEAKEMSMSTEFLSVGAYFIEIQFDNGRMIRRKILKE